MDTSSTGIRLERATKAHARALARIARSEDRVEVRASGGMTAEQAVRASINRSQEAWAAYAGPDLLMVFGITDCGNGWVIPWALSSVHVQKHQRAFWRTSKLVVDHYREQYPQMVQMVHARYTAALRWLERLGFKVEPPVHFGAEQALFCRVEMITPKLIVERAHV